MSVNHERPTLERNPMVENNVKVSDGIIRLKFFCDVQESAL